MQKKKRMKKLKVYDEETEEENKKRDLYAKQIGEQFKRLKIKPPLPNFNTKHKERKTTRGGRKTKRGGRKTKRGGRKTKRVATRKKM